MISELKNILAWELFNKPNAIRLWIYLLINASEINRVQYGVELKRGQLLTTNKLISNATGLTSSQIRTAFEALKDRVLLKTTERLAERFANRMTLITICGYEDYASLFKNESQNVSQCDSQCEDKENNKEDEVKEKREKEDFLPLEPLLFQEKEINKENEGEEKTKETEAIWVAKATLSTGVDGIDFKQIVNLWNSICGSIFPPVQKLTQSRKDKIKVRAHEIQKDGGDLIETFTRVFTLATESRFFREKWHPKFDWFFENDKNYVKVLEGNYNSNPINLNDNTDEARAARFARGEQYLAEQRERDKAFIKTFGTILD